MADVIVPGTTSDQLRALIRREAQAVMQQYAGGGHLNHASISRGNLTVRGGGSIRVQDGGEVLVDNGGAVRVFGPAEDTVVFYAGDDGVGGQLVLMERGDGSAAFTMQASTIGDDFWRLFAANGTELISEDTAAGNALARPYIPLTMQPGVLGATVAGWPGTTSAAFGTAWEGGWWRMHPRLQTRVLLLGEAGATGEARLVIDGTVVGAAVPIEANTISAHEWTSTWPATVDPYERAQATIEVRRTNGVGLARAGFLFAWGIQS